MENRIQKLNIFLADLNVFYRKLQNYHWNIVGKDFFVIHAKLEEYYDEINTQIDEIAEHILMLGGEPVGTMKDYLEMTTIQEAKNEKVDDQTVFQHVLEDYESLRQKVIEIKKEAEEQNNYHTSSLMDEYLATYTKIIWMIKQMQEKI